MSLRQRAGRNQEGRNQQTPRAALPAVAKQHPSRKPGRAWGELGSAGANGSRSLQPVRGGDDWLISPPQACCRMVSSAHQMTSTRPELRMARSRLTSGSLCRNAVETKTRSNGSACGSSSAMAAAAISASIGRMWNREAKSFRNGVGSERTTTHAQSRGLCAC